VLLVSTAFAAAAEAQAYKWSVQYLIDNSQSVFGRLQAVYPRRNRGLAISPDGRYLYAGYHQSFDPSGTYRGRASFHTGFGEVRRIDLSAPDYEKATLAVVRGPLGKAIATDEEGRVYIADQQAIRIYDALLSRQQLAVPANDSEGVAVTRESGTLVLYATERNRGTLGRWVLAKQGKYIVGAELAGLAGDGHLEIPNAGSLRGIAIDSKGRIWIADLDGNKVFRVEADRKTIAFAEVATPIAMAFDGPKCFVTQWQKRQITILDEEMRALGTLAAPWEELELAPLGNNRQGALSGIAAVPGKGFYVANEGGQTANQKSTYGRPDEHTDFVNGKLYIDAFMDDNEPILHAVPVSAETAPR
jgi:hypothetical protein